MEGGGDGSRKETEEGLGLRDGSGCVGSVKAGRWGWTSRMVSKEMVCVRERREDKHTLIPLNPTCYNNSTGKIHLHISDRTLFFFFIISKKRIITFLIRTSSNLDLITSK